MKNPGVREMMEVYDKWLVLEKAVRPYQQSAVCKRVVSVSDRTT
jgi:hypothetical protein